MASADEKEMIFKKLNSLQYLEDMTYSLKE